MLNVCTIAGRICNDIELKHTPTGVAVCEFRIAVDRAYKVQGEKKTDFFTVKCWRELAELVCDKSGKGLRIIASGAMENREWLSQDGAKRSVTELNCNTLRFIDWRGDETSGNAGGETAATPSATDPNDYGDPFADQ